MDPRQGSQLHNATEVAYILTQLHANVDRLKKFEQHHPERSQIVGTVERLLENIRYELGIEVAAANTGGEMMGDLSGEINRNVRYTGTIKSFVLSKGFGFIACPALMKKYGADVFVHKNEWVSNNFKEGMKVSFRINLNNQMQPQAVDVRIMDQKGGHGGGNPHMAYNPMMGGGVPAHQPIMQQQMPSRFSGQKRPAPYSMEAFHDMKRPRQNTIQNHGVSGGGAQQMNQMGDFVHKQTPKKIDGGPYNGTLKSYNETTGFGFIACDETFAMYNRDIFLHKNEAEKIQNRKMGDHVIFSLQLNEQGAPQAVGVELI